MSDTVFRSVSNEPPAQPIPVPEGDNKTTFTESVKDLEPVEKGDGTMYEILKTEDNLPEEAKTNVSELENYLFDILKLKGIDPTAPAIEREITLLREEMGLDDNASVETLLDRVGGVIKAWKSLSFVKDQGEKRKIFFKLANAPTGKDMNRIVFEEMERRQIWQ